MPVNKLPNVLDCTIHWVLRRFFQFALFGNSDRRKALDLINFDAQLPANVIIRRPLFIIHIGS